MKWQRTGQARSVSDLRDWIWGRRRRTRNTLGKCGRTRRGKGKAAPDDEKKGTEFNLTNIKQLEKQTNYLAKLEHPLQPLRKLTKSSELQSKLVKDYGFRAHVLAVLVSKI
jgi:hypothetical protein